MAGFTEQERVKGFALFDEDASTNQVAAQVFNRNYGKAKKLREEYDALPVEEGEPEPEVDDGDAPDTWNLTLEVPVARMDESLQRFSPQEKADAISTVLQSRLNAEA
jgi:hypothetical protein